MQYRTPACHLTASECADSSPEHAHTPDTPTAGTEQAYAPVPAACQWATTTLGRIAPDPYSWLQAVHWYHGAGVHQPAKGPRFCDTTIRIARILATLTPCRPSVAYLMRLTGLSERTIQNHLAILRTTGLLVYTAMGGRRKGATALASEFVRVIPPVFDTALGIRTAGDGPSRRIVGIAERGRKVIAKLAKLAAAKRRRKPAKKAAAAGRRCTPMGVGTTRTSSHGGTHSPSESKLASGKPKSPTPKKPNRGPRKLNKIGRRYQLAGELIARVDWLAGHNRARVAWLVRHVADAGWTATEVIAWLGNGEPPQHIRRASAFLAHRLAAALDIWPTEAARREGVEGWRDAVNAAKPRRPEWEHGNVQGPRSTAVQRLVADAFAQVDANVIATSSTVFEYHVDDAPQQVEDFTRHEVIDIRAQAERNPELVHAAIAVFGERDARRLLTNRIVNNTLNPAHGSAYTQIGA